MILKILIRNVKQLLINDKYKRKVVIIIFFIFFIEILMDFTIFYNSYLKTKTSKIYNIRLARCNYILHVLNHLHNGVNTLFLICFILHGTKP